MDWMGFDWDGDGYVDFEESMMTFAAFRMMQLQRENELLHRQLEDINNLDDSSFDIPFGLIYPTYDYQRGSGSGISINRILEASGKYLGRLIRFLFSLLVYVVRGWKLIYEISHAKLNKLSQSAKFTKYQRIILSLLLTITLIITVAIAILVVISFTNIP